ncbi:hypothetical protein [Chitinimonas sp. BJYL2]|uniref:hypothetical protein n=1 Tax=Chitinimonas sp. BJYL2 TaxID=2976696 RepID=UPI0022B3E000|nr:hypothetical protein [Chitinimonas sp. BJYL2]
MTSFVHIRQRGQAMIETLIACSLVLVPLFLALPVIAKYLDIRSHAVQAARYAAWERTVFFGGDAASELGWIVGPNAWKANEKTEGAVKSEIAARVLSKPSDTAKVESADSSSSNFKGAANGLWQDRIGTSMLAYGDVQGAVGQECDPSGDIGGAIFGGECAPGTVNSVIMPVVAVASSVGPFTLEMGGKYTATVTLGAKSYDPNSYLMSAALARKPMTETSVVLGNGWSAEGPNTTGRIGVTQQVKGLTPLSLLAAEIDMGSLGSLSILNVIQTVMSIWAPELHPRKLQIGKIAPDEVPADRLE